jgi:CubicO group peptidase (beta-lactamase class C family)
VQTCQWSDYPQEDIWAGGITNQLIWGKGYGLADLDKETPVTLDTRFRIASITKTFTATAILQLRDAGRLKLDDPVSEYLDWFDLHYNGAPPITIRHLLTHTSGLPRDATIPHWTENAFQSWEELMATTKQRKPTMPPLLDYSYSNLGYSLLGGIVEAVSDMAWADYIQQEILDRLGMTDTVVAPKGHEANLATGYLNPDAHRQCKPAPFAATNGFSASASMASSVNDLVKYAGFHLTTQDNPVLSGYSLREMHQIYWLNKDWKAGYGLGTQIMHIGDWTISGHSGGYKGYLTQFTVCREHQFGVIVLTNSLDSEPFPMVERAYKMVLPEVLKVTNAELLEAKPEWRLWVGTYQDDWGDTEIFIRGGQLQMVSIRFLDLPPAILEPTELPHEFIIKQPSNPGETVQFELDDMGNVKRVWVRNEYLLPKKLVVTNAASGSE